MYLNIVVLRKIQKEVLLSVRYYFTRMKLKQGISDVEEMLRISQAHVAPYTTKVFDKTIWCHPEVCSPKYSYSSRFFIDHWDVSDGQTVLDMGTGTGILALFAAFAGAKEIVATDINFYACETAKRNVERYQLQDKVMIVEGDLFQPVESSKFDRILFNLPYWNRQANTELEKAFFDKEYNILTSFLAEAKNHLNVDGKVLLSFSELGDVDFLESKITSYDYKILNRIRQDASHVRLLYFLG